MTIINAIKEVMKKANKPLTGKETYHLIIESNLYTFPAKNPEHVVKTTIRRHCLGLDFPTSKKVKYFKIVENKGSASKYFLIEASDESKEKQFTKTVDNDRLPEEIIFEAHSLHRNNLKQELLDLILSSEPSFFEQMVVELLLKMDYGWDEKESGVVRGRVGDEGIDGVIFEDRLGLGKIYIQAKRYNNNSIGRPDIQQFIGAMENNKKGVFITTSTFTKQAREFVDRQVKDIALIDGDMLTDLLISNNIGISITATISTYQINRDYFEI
ncbi:restriction endonuclease [Sulfurospirillum cavolei]|uniref:restriction endonuclease n=1 Tax=Sulfurospirillum cavolei TaxID=366522 RepID=UPI0005A92497|nr:restriction endonuclease [Sulfurospirillum cavolei]